MHIQKAVDYINQKKCVVFPTETVYGLGADALDAESAENIFKLKNRPPSNPLIVHLPDIDGIYSVAENITELELRLLEHFSPGPLSLILPKKSIVPDIVTGGLDTVGVRIPSHPVALEFLRAVKKPICAPSANISGKPSPTTYEMAEFYMGGKDVVILDGGSLECGLESTVIKVENSDIYLLRAGSVTPEMIFDFTGIMPEQDKKQNHQSPGTRYPHYKPQGRVFLYDTGKHPPEDNQAALLCLKRPNSDYSKIYHFESVRDYAHSLYDVFFQCDKLGIKTIICELPPADGEGLALRDRLMRAAE